MKRPNIFEFLDISDYLKEIYKFKKHNEKNFSYEVWVSELELKSRGHLRAIVIGETKLTENLVESFIKGLSLTASEAEYFLLLTKYSCADSPQFKEIYGKSLIPLWQTNLRALQINDIAEFLSDTIIPVVFTYLSFEDTPSDMNIMSEKLNCNVERIQNAIKCLVWQKLVDGIVNESGEITYKTTKPFFNIPTSPNNFYLKNFHLEGLKLAEKAHDFPADLRKYYTTFVALSPEQLLKAQQIIQDCNQRILALFNTKELENKNIYRLNVQIFPVSNISQKPELTENEFAVEF